MDRYEKAALLDFFATVIWATRTVRLVTTGGGEATFTLNAPVGGWATATDTPMAWINGNRVSGTITWVNGTTVTLPVTAPLGSQVIVLVSPGLGSGYLPRTGLAAMLGALNMDNWQIENLGASTAAHHAVRRDEVMAIVAALVGGNYVAKAGDQMVGPLLLPAAASLTNASAAVRRDMVALLDASQDFTGKQRAPSTVDADHAQTLTTKDYVDEMHDSTRLDTGTAYVSPGEYSFLVPPGVTEIIVLVKGGDGGNGGPSGVALGTTYSYPLN